MFTKALHLKRIEQHKGLQALAKNLSTKRHRHAGFLQLGIHTRVFSHVFGGTLAEWAFEDCHLDNVL